MLQCILIEQNTDFSLAQQRIVRRSHIKGDDTHLSGQSGIVDGFTYAELTVCRDIDPAQIRVSGKDMLRNFVGKIIAVKAGLERETDDVLCVFGGQGIEEAGQAVVMRGIVQMPPASGNTFPPAGRSMRINPAAVCPAR